MIRKIDAELQKELLRQLNKMQHACLTSNEASKAFDQAFNLLWNADLINKK